MGEVRAIKIIGRLHRGWWLLPLLILLPGWVQGAEFSATRVVTWINNRETQSKVYIKGDKISIDQKVYVAILRPDRNIAWVILPAKKVYIELPITDPMAVELTKSFQNQGKVFLGTEEVSGYLTDKYEKVVKDDGGSFKSTYWVARKLGMPIKVVDPSGSIMEYRDIKEGEVPDAVFEVPSGYQKQGSNTLIKK